MIVPSTAMAKEKPELSPIEIDISQFESRVCESFSVNKR